MLDVSLHAEGALGAARSRSKASKRADAPLRDPMPAESGGVGGLGLRAERCATPPPCYCFCVSWCRVLPVACFLFACAPSEEEVQAEFKEFVSTKKACSIDDDCVIAATGCPLGCGTAVNKKHQREVEAKADELIEDYESNGRSCDYECVGSVAVCAEGRCDEQSM